MASAVMMRCFFKIAIVTPKDDGLLRDGELFAANVPHTVQASLAVYGWMTNPADAPGPFPFGTFAVIFTTVFDAAIAPAMGNTTVVAPGMSGTLAGMLTLATSLLSWIIIGS